MSANRVFAIQASLFTVRHFCGVETPAIACCVMAALWEPEASVRDILLRHDRLRVLAFSESPAAGRAAGA
ncbi:hypothetical protein, partial [Ahrensia marina]|uniref:hypothetical protein n=1 Tax=Ahrensia marina TaxID=1514904 RepID=UPI001B3BB6EE